jgi:hypothetical protein
MKKTFLLFITFYCWLFTSQAQSFYEMDKQNLEGFGLKGKVLSFKDTEYKAIDSSGVIKRGVKQYIIVFLFNKMGYMIEMNQYFPDGSLNAKNTNQYDAKGNIENNLYDAKGKWLGKTKILYKYDTSGNVIETKNYDSEGKFLGKSDNKYNFNGKKIEWLSYNAKDSLESIDIFKYDAKGTMVERDYCNPKGSLIYKNIYINDTNGNMIEWDLYKSDGSLKTKRTYKYDFDLMLNWIKKTEIRNDVPNKITERKIKYY